jgi:hypothetical protein
MEIMDLTECHRIQEITEDDFNLLGCFTEGSFGEFKLYLRFS